MLASTRKDTAKSVKTLLVLLQSLKNQQVSITLRNDSVVRGTVLGVDSNMNFELKDATVEPDMFYSTTATGQALLDSAAGVLAGDTGAEHNQQEEQLARSTSSGAPAKRMKMDIELDGAKVNNAGAGESTGAPGGGGGGRPPALKTGRGADDGSLVETLIKGNDYECDADDVDVQMTSSGAPDDQDSESDSEEDATDDDDRLPDQRHQQEQPASSMRTSMTTGAPAAGPAAGPPPPPPPPVINDEGDKHNKRQSATDRLYGYLLVKGSRVRHVDVPTDFDLLAGGRGEIERIRNRCKQWTKRDIVRC